MTSNCADVLTMAGIVRDGANARTIFSVVDMLVIAFICGK
jgi:hypothetical protein